MIDPHSRRKAEPPTWNFWVRSVNQKGRKAADLQRIVDVRATGSVIAKDLAFPILVKVVGWVIPTDGREDGGSASVVRRKSNICIPYLVSSKKDPRAIFSVVSSPSPCLPATTQQG